MLEINWIETIVVRFRQCTKIPNSIFKIHNQFKKKNWYYIQLEIFLLHKGHSFKISRRFIKYKEGGGGSGKKLIENV